jgi:hypothetical protein
MCEHTNKGTGAQCTRELRDGGEPHIGAHRYPPVEVS